jgi:hypothetical protein
MQVLLPMQVPVQVPIQVRVLVQVKAAAIACLHEQKSADKQQESKKQTVNHIVRAE